MNFVDRLHLNVGANYQLNRNFPLAQPDTSAVAQQYAGPGVEAQVGGTLLQVPHFDLSTGLQFSYSSLTTPASIPTRSQVSQISLGAFVAATALIHRHFGIGVEGSAAYQCIDSSNLDVGLPFTASTECFSNGGFALGARAYLSTFFNTIQAGISLNHMPAGIPLSSGALQIVPSLALAPFIRVDILQLFRHL